MNILAYVGAIAVPIAVPWISRNYSWSNVKTFCLSMSENMSVMCFVCLSLYVYAGFDSFIISYVGVEAFDIYCDANNSSG